MNATSRARIHLPAAAAILAAFLVGLVPAAGVAGKPSSQSLQTMVSTPSAAPVDRTAIAGSRRQKTAQAATGAARRRISAASDGSLMNDLRQVLDRRPQDDASAAHVAQPALQEALRSLMAAHPQGQTMRIGFTADGTTPRFIKFDRSSKSKFQRPATMSESRTAARQFLSANRMLLGLAAPDEEMTIRRQWVDPQGNSHFRFQQTIDGIPVWGHEAMVHLDAGSRIYLFQGRYADSGRTGSVDTVPGIDGDGARNALAAHLGRPVDGDLSTELVIHAAEDGSMALAYKMDLGVGIAQRWIYFVDAQSGEIRHRLSGINNQVITSSGTDLNGASRSFTAWSENGTDYLVDPSIPLADPPYQPVPEMQSKGNTYILTAKNGSGDSLYFLTRSSNAAWDAAGVSAAHAVRQVYDYYHQTHGRNGIDDNYLNYLVVVHFGQKEANAFWNGKFVVLGDGDNQTFSSLAGSLDVIAHEIQHGVTEFTAGLIYENQSGALNEAYSDIFACMVDRDDWTVGEDVTVASPGYLRSLAHPDQGLSALPTKMSEYRNLPNTESGDWGGVHINMSIPSRAAYLMADGLSAEGLGTSIGRNKTEKIFYRALTTYLQSSSGFQDARVATIQAAEDLYGANGSEVTAVKAAWHAVEIDDTDSDGTAQDNRPTPTDSVAGQDLMVYLYPNDASHTPWMDGETYQLYCQTLPTPFSGYDPDQDIQLFTGNVAYTRPSLYTDEYGTLVFFVDTFNDLWAVSADGSGPQQITSSGDIYSFAISPDGQYFAYTTPSADDNNIYVGDLTSGAVTAYPLEPFNDLPPGNYGTINTILYADALSFDYTSRQIVFDALNCISTPQNPCSSSGGGYRYWSIGFLNVTDGTLSFPFPNQNPDYDIGFPKFAANNSYVVAVDVIDNSEYAYTGAIYSSVWTLNWKDQTSHLIVDPNMGTDDYPIYGTPSFWGGDDYLTVQMADDFGGSAYRVPIDAAWQGNAQNLQRLNDYDVAMPQMHRAGVRTLSGTLTPSTQSLAFTSGKAETRELVLKNTGNRDIQITNIAISGASGFSHNGINALLPHGKSMTIRVTYAPVGSGTGGGAALGIESDADNPTLTIALTTSSAGGWATLPTGGHQLGIRALIHTEDKGVIDGVWKKGGEASLSVGKLIWGYFYADPAVGKLIWGYFYADPAAVSWGNADNPDVFVKILVSPDESWVNINYFHVSVPDIEVFSDYPYDGTADGHDTATGPNGTSLRFVEHTFLNGVLANKPTTQYEDGLPASGDRVAGNPTGVVVASGVRIGAMINAVSEADLVSIVPTEGLWKKGGEADIGVGRIIWGYFYANPADVSWGSANNPDLFVKLLVGEGWMIANYFHVSAPDIEAYCDFGNNRVWENGATAKLANRFIEFRY